MNRARSLVGREMIDRTHLSTSRSQARTRRMWPLGAGLHASGSSESGASGDHCCRTRQAVIPLVSWVNVAERIEQEARLASHR